MDLRSLIIDHCLKNGGDLAHLYLPVTFDSDANKYSVTAKTDSDLEVIEVLKTVRGSVQRRVIRTLLQAVGDVENISLSPISKAIKSKLLSGKRHTRKITHVAKESFTPENIAYT